MQEEKRDTPPSSESDRGGTAGEGSGQIRSRRDFFTGLGKWSKIVIGAVLLGTAALPGEGQSQDRPKWYNDRCGPSWQNFPQDGGQWNNWNNRPWSNWNNGSADQQPPGEWNNWSNIR